MLATRYFLAPLAGYTHLAFRRVVRACGGVGLATTDLVQATHLVSGTRWARELVATHPEDQPLSVQIYGESPITSCERPNGLKTAAMARRYQHGLSHGQNHGQGGGARLMCDNDGACTLVAAW